MKDNNFYTNFKIKFISISLKYQKEVNFVFLSGICIYLFITVDWVLFFSWMLQFPTDLLNLVYTIKDLIVAFLIKFYNDLITYPTNLKIISVGIFKRFLFEDIIFPILIKYYWVIIKEDMILHYKLKYRELKKFPIILRTALASPFMGAILGIVSYFKIFGFITYWIKKIFANTIFSKMKYFFIKFIPAAWIIMMDMPIISIIIDYFALTKMLDWIKNINVWGITHIFRYFKFLGVWADRQIAKIFNVLEKSIGVWLRSRAINKKFIIRNKIDIILKENSDDYHVLSVGYNNHLFKKKMIRINNWRKIRKEKKWNKRKLYFKTIGLRIKKIPNKIKMVFVKTKT